MMKMGPRLAAISLRPMSRRPESVRLPLLYRRIDSGPIDENRTGDPHTRDELLAVVEAILVMADEPLTSKKIAELSGMPDGHVARKHVERLRDWLDAEESPFSVAELAGGFRLLTRPEYHHWLTRLRRTGHELRLSTAAMETFADIAYKQPVMKAEIEGIRGVACGDIIHLLMEKGLVRPAGRHDSLGRPQLYGTTNSFLAAFGLQSLDQLPEVPALKKPVATPSR